MTLEEEAALVEHFIANQVRLGRSPQTVAIRRLYLNRFLKVFGTFDVTTRQIQTWLNSQNLKDATKRTYLAHYSEYYKWAIRGGFLDDDPAIKIRIPGQPEPPPSISFTGADIERALDTAHETSHAGADDGDIRCWIALAAYQGMKVGEIADLTTQDVNLTDQLIRYRTTSPWPRSTNLHPLVTAALEALPLRSQGRLFPDANAPRVSKAVSKHLHSCGIDGSAKSLVQWHGEQVEADGTNFGRTSTTDTQFDESGIDPALWNHIAGYVTNGDWGTVARETAVFTEDSVRRWGQCPNGLVGKDLMTAVFGDQGMFRLGSTEPERKGWHLLAMGISAALRNVDAHRIQVRNDHKKYATGVVGVSSLLITQLRHQYGNLIT
jgi:integrase